MALVLAIATLALATYAAGVRVDLVFVLFVPAIVIGGALIDLGISLAIATCSFWFIRVDTLRWVVMSLEQDFTRYPISIYTRGVRIVLAFVLPFAFMNYFPATYFLQKDRRGIAPQPGRRPAYAGDRLGVVRAPPTCFGSSACATTREPARETHRVLRRRRCGARCERRPSAHR